MGDVGRLLVLGLGTIAWIQGYHLHFYNCRRVSVLGGSWLSSEMGSGRILRLLAIFCFPTFPGTRVFPALGEGGVNMDIDNTNIRDEQMPQAPNQPPSSAVDAELAELFGCDIRDIREDRHLQASDGHAGNTGQEFFCPIEGCARSRSNGPSWSNRDALRARIDLHCIGELQGQPSAEWLRQQRLQGCRVCGRTLNIRFASGVHVYCWPRIRTAEGANPPQIAPENLPSLHDIFTPPIFAKDHLPAELWPQIRSEYARLLAAVVSSNRRDAWDDAPAAVDRDIPSENAGKERARRAWTELLIFPKSVCKQNKRGQRQGQAIAFTRSLLTRWKMGERQGL